MKMKKYFALIAILSLAAGVFAQQNKYPQIKDPAAKEVLDKLVEKSNTFKTVKSKFSFTLENLQEDIKEEYLGEVSFKGDSYRLNLMGLETYCDGTTIWSHIVDADEVNISNRDPNDKSFMNNPKKIFSGYHEDFKYKLVGEQKTDARVIVQIELYPEHLEQGLLPDEESAIDYSKILLTIDKSKYELISVKYFGQNGSNYFIEVSEFVTNTAIQDDFFVFDPQQFPDVELVDLREEE